MFGNEPSTRMTYYTKKCKKMQKMQTSNLILCTTWARGFTEGKSAIPDANSFHRPTYTKMIYSAARQWV